MQDPAAGAPAGRLDATIPPTLGTPGAAGFWLAVLLTGVGTGIAAALLTRLLDLIQHAVWPGTDLLDAATVAGPWRHIGVLLGAGALVGVGQFVLLRLTSANGIDIAEAITRHAGRLPAVRTVGSALLSIVVVGMGASLGREGAPKQVGAVVANVLSDRARLSDEQRRLLVACGAGAGMAAAYGVPLGGALFSLEVLRGVLALRLILPALLSASIATGVSWLALPNAPTYVIPAYRGADHGRRRGRLRASDRVGGSPQTPRSGPFLRALARARVAGAGLGALSAIARQRQGPCAIDVRRQNRAGADVGSAVPEAARHDALSR
jgi:hypothetical protein